MFDKLFRYYNGEQKNPFDSSSFDFDAWNAEQIMKQGDVLTNRYNRVAPGDYPEWCKEFGDSLEERCYIWTLYDLVCKLVNYTEDPMKFLEMMKKD